MKKVLIFIIMAINISATGPRPTEAAGKEKTSFSSSDVVPQDSTSRRPKVALVLGGGGAKGAAEIGAIKVIEEAGVPIDCVVGTSIGAIVGGMYAIGVKYEEMADLFLSINWFNTLSDRNDDLMNQPWKKKNGTFYLFGVPIYNEKDKTVGLLNGTNVVEKIDSILESKGRTTFDKTLIPFKCVAADPMGMEEVILDEGKLSEAMRASMSIPGIYKPVKIDGRWLVDGGVLNNLPVDVARQMGADIVIAIDLQTSESDEADADDDSEPIFNQKGLLGIFDWLLVQPQAKKRSANIADADIYIKPPLSLFDFSSFGNKNAKRMIEIGEEETRKHWDELTSLANAINALPNPDSAAKYYPLKPREE